VFEVQRVHGALTGIFTSELIVVVALIIGQVFRERVGRIQCEPGFVAMVHLNLQRIIEGIGAVRARIDDAPVGERTAAQRLVYIVGG